MILDQIYRTKNEPKPGNKPPHFYLTLFVTEHFHDRGLQQFEHFLRILEGFLGKSSSRAWKFQIFSIFHRPAKIFLLNRFENFWMFWKAMILIRSFLLSKSRRPRLRHPLVPLLWEDFGKIPISHLHHPNIRVQNPRENPRKICWKNTKKNIDWKDCQK